MYRSNRENNCARPRTRDGSSDQPREARYQFGIVALLVALTLWFGSIAPAWSADFFIPGLSLEYTRDDSFDDNLRTNITLPVLRIKDPTDPFQNRTEVFVGAILSNRFATDLLSGRTRGDLDRGNIFISARHRPDRTHEFRGIVEAAKTANERFVSARGDYRLTRRDVEVFAEVQSEYRQSKDLNALFLDPAQPAGYTVGGLRFRANLDFRWRNLPILPQGSTLAIRAFSDGDLTRPIGDNARSNKGVEFELETPISSGSAPGSAQGPNQINFDAPRVAFRLRAEDDTALAEVRYDAILKRSRNFEARIRANVVAERSTFLAQRFEVRADGTLGLQWRPTPNHTFRFEPGYRFTWPNRDLRLPIILEHDWQVTPQLLLRQSVNSELAKLRKTLTYTSGAQFIRNNWTAEGFGRLNYETNLGITERSLGTRIAYNRTLPDNRNVGFEFGAERRWPRQQRATNRVFARFNVDF